MNLDHITRGSGMRRHNRHLPTGNLVQKGRFAGIRRPGNRHDQAFPHPLAPSALGQDRSNFLLQRTNRLQSASGDIGGDIRLVGEVDSRLDQGQSLDQPAAPSLSPVSQQSLQLPDCLFPLGFGVGIDEIGQTLDGRQIQLAVFEGPAVNSPASAIRVPSSFDSALKVAATTARPPCNWSSATSSPVSLLGPSKNSTSA